MPRDRPNLLIERSAILKAKEYSRRHKTSISGLVTQFLDALPDDTDASAGNISPTVRRLMGKAAGIEPESYKSYLERKYGPCS